MYLLISFMRSETKVSFRPQTSSLSQTSMAIWRQKNISDNRTLEKRIKAER